jgi:glucose-6-phosphate 1-dehydrogenase
VIARLVLFGATGDLAGRFLLPALARLLAAGHVPQELQVVAAAPQDWEDETFREHAAQRLQDHAADLSASDHQALLERLTYARVDFAELDSVRHAIHGPTGTAAEAAPVAAYLALPQRLFAPAIQALGASDLPPGSRVAVEKPFGQDLAGAVSLNALLAQVSDVGEPEAVFRVDHALGMPGAQQLLALRSAQTAPFWDGAHIQQIDVLWEETIGLEGRADFFDRTGALRDVLQNHMIQVLALVAMELPPSTSERDWHDAKLALLQATRPLDGSRRARFSAGTLAVSGTAVPGYAQEEGVDPDRDTETYAELVLQVDHPRWSGTRFVLRAGKALASDRKGVLIHFSPGLGPAGSPASEQLWIPMDGPAASVDGELSAYGKVLLDVLSGSNRLSVSAEESEQAWRIVEPVLHDWAQGTVPLLEYPAGSAGPAHLLPSR